MLHLSGRMGGEGREKEGRKWPKGRGRKGVRRRRV